MVIRDADTPVLGCAVSVHVDWINPTYEKWSLRTHSSLEAPDFLICLSVNICVPISTERWKLERGLFTNTPYLLPKDVTIEYSPSFKMLGPWFWMFPDIGRGGRETRAHNISFLYESILVAFRVEIQEWIDHDLPAHFQIAKHHFLLKISPAYGVKYYYSFWSSSGRGRWISTRHTAEPLGWEAFC